MAATACIDKEKKKHTHIHTYTQRNTHSKEEKEKKRDEKKNFETRVGCNYFSKPFVKMSRIKKKHKDG